MKKIIKWPNKIGYWWAQDKMGMFLAKSIESDSDGTFDVQICGGIDDQSVWCENDLPHCSFFYLSTEFPTE